MGKFNLLHILTQLTSESNTLIDIAVYWGIIKKQTGFGYVFCWNLSLRKNN